MIGGFELNMMQAEFAQFKGKNDMKHSEIEYRIEQAIKDQNEKIDVLLDFLKLTMKVETPKSSYKIYEISEK